MHLFPAPASVVLCLAMLLLTLPIASSTVDAINTTNTTSPFCEPARCGNLTIGYPFWLAGKHPPECGYRAFQVTCDHRNASLKNGFWTYQIQHIFYHNSSFMVTNEQLTDGQCVIESFVNASSDLGLTPFKISPINRELIFLYNCNQSRLQQLPPSWAPVSCAENESPNSYAWLAGRYKPDDDLRQQPGNCTVSMIPVLGYDGAAAKDYERLIKGGFLLDYTAGPDDCEDCSRSGRWCRVNVTYDGLDCQCPEGITSSGFMCGTKKTGRKIILIVLTAAAAGLLLPCLYVLIWHRKGKKLRHLLCTKTSSTSERNIEALIESYGSIAPTRYKYSEVTKITSFLNYKLGEGGYGVVFKGRLQDGRMVAVKFLHDSKGNGEEFVNEVMSIGRTSHINIVSLFGFCLEGSKRALVYEYMPNGSLDNYIYSENPKEILGWEKLYGIAIRVARGLEYLHHSCNTRIIHFDIKPQNILLDQDFCPKIADFGLAKLCRTKESKLSMTGARGTIGFIAPEVIYRTFGVVSTKSDVYSYGMMLLEMVGGRKNAKQMVENSSEKYFPDWIYDHFALDDGLQACQVTSEVEQIAKKMTLIGLWCVQVLPMHRPTITQVLDMFERGLDELEMPPKQNFSELLDHSVHELNTESKSSTGNTKAAQA
ncbi:hypothetical protein DAI22_01g026200 [Oryza sativa Japonica Group]|nr:hypothetical protein DAI22_01g026200 [Oryza sativa Japonica Group]